ncbi:hypothetical protein [Streptomyces adustus]
MHDIGRDQDREARAAAAERLGKRFAEADADGILASQETTDALKQHDPWSVDRDVTRTVVVVRGAASGWAQCYAHSATRTGSVAFRPLGFCPATSPAVAPDAPTTGDRRPS